MLLSQKAHFELTCSAIPETIFQTFKFLKYFFFIFEQNIIFRYFKVLIIINYFFLYRIAISKYFDSFEAN